MTASGQKKRTCFGSARSGAAALLVLVGGGLFLASADPARAQAPLARRSPIVVGTPATDEILASDPVDDNGQRYRDYVLQLRRGERVQIDMDAVSPTPTFDTYLVLLSADGGEPLRFNDDRGDGTLNSSVFFEAPEDGIYLVRAEAFARGTGAYRLSVSQVASPPAPERIAGGTVSGSLGPRSPVIEINGRPRRFAEYVFHADAGNRARIELHGGGSGKWLQLFGAEGLILENFGSMAETDSQIVAVLAEGGDYRVRVMGSASTSADYSLLLETVAPPPPPLTMERLVPGIDTTGRLGLDSPVATHPLSNNRIAYFYQYFNLQVRQGEQLAVRLSPPTAGFHPILEAGGLTPLGFAMVVSTEGQAVAVLGLRPERGGVLRLRVRSPSSGPSIGDFTLRVDEVAPAPATACTQANQAVPCP